MEREIIKPNDLIIETEFYKWLSEEAKNGRKMGYFIPLVKRYIGGGDSPFKDRVDGVRHKSVYTIWILNHRQAVSSLEA